MSRATYPSPTSPIFTFATGAMGLLPFYIWELSCRGAFALNISTALSILYIALFPSIVAFFCWNRGVASIGANRAGLFVNLVPVFASILAIIWLGESLRAFHIVGMFLIFTGMVLKPLLSYLSKTRLIQGM